MNFTIDDNFLTTITIVKQYNRFPDKETLTDEELISFLKNPVICTSTHTEDHPEFAKLRNQLEDLGYIKCQRGWWNGDTVLKPFTLNGAKFKKNEQFHCAAAMKFTVQSKCKERVV